jgi:hypothetical protein
MSSISVSNISIPRPGINWRPKSAPDIQRSLSCFFAQVNLRYFSTVYHRRGGSTPNPASNDYDGPLPIFYVMVLVWDCSGIICTSSRHIYLCVHPRGMFIYIGLNKKLLYFSLQFDLVDHQLDQALIR